MYICQLCGENSKPGEECHKVVTERRHHQHPERLAGGPLGTKYVADRGGPGTQIVSEVNACARCAAHTVAKMTGGAFESALAYALGEPSTQG